MHNKIPYGPKYFLSALGAGGIAVTFFMYLQFLTKHATPMATFDTILPYLSQGLTLPAILIVIALAGIAFFGILHLRLVGWNIREYGKFKKSDAYKHIKTTNDEVDLMGFPLILAMMLNVLLILGGVFIPGLWSIIEYIFPLAIIGFFATGIFALVTYLPFVTRSFTSGFDFEKNNKLGQLKASLTFLMVAVGLAAPVTMSQTFSTASISLILSLFFLLIGMVFFVLHTIWGMQAIMKHGMAFESSSSIWVPIPIFTLMGVTIVRYMLGMTRVFDMPVSNMSFLLVLTLFIALQVLFGVIGYALMKHNGYFTTYLTGKEKSLNTFALICPGVAGVVLGFFFVHQGLIRFGLFEMYSIPHYILLFGLFVLQLITIKTFFRVKNILFYNFLPSFFMENVISCTGSNFQSTIASGVTVVDFWAPWCGPCQMMLPILAEFASISAGTVTVAKVNVDEEGAIAQQYHIMSIPTLIVFKDGKKVDQLVGVQSAEKLKAVTDGHK